MKINAAKEFEDIFEVIVWNQTFTKDANREEISDTKIW